MHQPPVTFLKAPVLTTPKPVNLHAPGSQVTFQHFLTLKSIVCVYRLLSTKLQPADGTCLDPEPAAIKGLWAIPSTESGTPNHS